VFAREDGSDLHAELVTKTFARLVKSSGLRRVRLNDLRHGAASLMLAGGVDVAVVSKRVGHSSIAITSDTPTATRSAESAGRRRMLPRPWYRPI
jgi:integrase